MTLLTSLRTVCPRTIRTELSCYASQTGTIDAASKGATNKIIMVTPSHKIQASICCLPPNSQLRQPLLCGWDGSTETLQVTSSALSSKSSENSPAAPQVTGAGEKR